LDKNNIKFTNTHCMFIADAVAETNCVSLTNHTNEH